MSFAPRPSPAACQQAASSAAGFSRSVAPARRRVHRRGAGEQRAHVDPLQRRRQQPDRARHGGAPADPVPHREALEAALLARLAVERAAVLVTATACGAEVEAARAVGRRGLEHAVARLRRAARLRDHDHERLGERRRRARPARGRCRRGRCCRGSAASSRSSAARQGVGHELRAERRAADADHEQVAEALGRGRRDAAGVHPGREVEHALAACARISARDLRRRGELRRAQPVVADHALLVGVGDRALLERLHRRRTRRRAPARAARASPRRGPCGSRSSRTPSAGSSNSSSW